MAEKNPRRIISENLKTFRAGFRASRVSDMALAEGGLLATGIGAYKYSEGNTTATIAAVSGGVILEGVLYAKVYMRGRRIRKVKNG